MPASIVELMICDPCEKLVTKKTFVQHWQFMHESRPKHENFTCEPCDLNFHHKSVLHQHWLGKSHAPKNYRCKDCGLRLAAVAHKCSYELNSVGTFTCDTCSRAFRYLGYLEAHAISVHSAEPKPSAKAIFACDECERNDFQQRSHLLTHLLTHMDKAASRALRKSGVKRASSSDTANCDACSHKVQHKSKLRSHWLRLHSTMAASELRKVLPGVLPHREPKACDACGTSFRRHEEIAIHVRSCVLRILNTRRERNRITTGTNMLRPPCYACDECGKALTRRVDLWNHLIRPHDNDGQPRLFCSHCGARHFEKKKLAAHIFNHHLSKAKRTRKKDRNQHRNLKIVTCHECDREMPLPRMFRHWLTRHNPKSSSEEEVQQKCDHCDGNFMLPSMLRLHWERILRRKTLRKGRVPCDDCPMAFGGRASCSSHSLAVHARLSSSGRKLDAVRCDCCGYVTRAKAWLRPHWLRLHSDLAAQDLRETLRMEKPSGGPCSRICDHCALEFDSYKRHASDCDGARQAWRDTTQPVEIRARGSNHRLVCEDCERVFHVGLSLRSHWLSQHAERKGQALRELRSRNARQSNYHAKKVKAK